MSSNGAAEERAEGHETMDEDEIPDTGMTAGHGTFVEDTGDVRGHRAVTKQNMSREGDRGGEKKERKEKK